MADAEIVFVDFPLASTGDTTGRALFRIMVDNEVVASVAVGMTRTRAATDEIGNDQEAIEAWLRHRAPQKLQTLHERQELRELPKLDEATFKFDFPS